MGRGRQKAKHTKVARELKYFSPDTNYGALEKELSTPHPDGEQYVDKWADEVDDETDEYVDRYADDFDAEHEQHKSA
ncbi:hypothetical protein GCM10025867_03290 [Frondihabitans sucicola]|uniref:DUF3073 domain-containing protein n=1 Tax=Frondihabitans sucicola TaxID=1268041 RepID=A0ABN6XT41_9MICO|nr:DUF3073 domain-containing protein [Frondihabitans sucicola]BDZ48088.1 hypothetical protein GCM10025867_03290 [Frondihabitans sucicola]